MENDQSPRLLWAADVAAHFGRTLWFVRQIHVWDPLAPGGRRPTGESVMNAMRIGPIVARNSGGAIRRIGKVRRNVPYRALYCLDLDALLAETSDAVRSFEIMNYTDRAEGLSAVFSDAAKADNHRVLIRLSADPSTISTMSFLMDQLAFNWPIERKSLPQMNFDTDRVKALA